MLDRRQLLRALGAGAAAAALTPLGCGHGPRRDAARAVDSPAALRQALRDAVAMLGERMDTPRAWLLSRRRVRVLVDVAVAEVIEERVDVAVLSARDDQGRRIERCFDDVTPARVAEAAEVIGAARGPRRARPAIPAPVDHGGPVEADPAKLGHADWLARARELTGRGEVVATSRIVYRAAWLVTDDDRVWAVGSDGDRHQRLVRSRIGATFVAWHGSTPQDGQAEIAGGFGPAVARLDDAAVARAAADALALYTPGAPPVGRQVVLLDPGVVAAVVDVHVRGPRRGPALASVTIVDDPTGDGFARSWFDDDGAPTRAVPLVGPGVDAAAALGIGHGRRAGASWRLAPAATQLAVLAGPSGAGALEGGIDAGLVLEGVRDVRSDGAGGVVVRVARGRQLAGGVRTGRQWADLELRATTAALLGDAVAVSAERQQVAVTDDGPARAVTAPWLLTRARVASARGPA